MSDGRLPSLARTRISAASLSTLGVHARWPLPYRSSASPAPSVLHVVPPSVDASTSTVGAATPAGLAAITSIPDSSEPPYTWLTSRSEIPVPPVAVTSKSSAVAFARPRRAGRLVDVRLPVPDPAAIGHVAEQHRLQHRQPRRAPLHVHRHACLKLLQPVRREDLHQLRRAPRRALRVAVGAEVRAAA